MREGREPGDRRLSAPSFEKATLVSEGEMGTLAAMKWHRFVKVSVSSSGTSESTTTTVARRSPLSKTCTRRRGADSLTSEGTMAPGGTFARRKKSCTSAVGSSFGRRSGTMWCWAMRWEVTL